MKKLMLASLLIAPTLAAHAQYTGPDASVATTVKQLTRAGVDDQRVMLRGHIVRRLSDKQYQFADNTGEIVVKIERERWPAEQPINETHRVELIGKYDKEMIGPSKVKVRSIKVIQ